MKKKLIFVLALACLCLAAVTQIDLATQVKGILLQANGGSGQSAYPVTVTVTSGAIPLDTNLIASGACDFQSTSTPGVQTTDIVRPGFSGDPTGVMGYVPSTSGMLAIISWPTADTVNIKVCNNTASDVTPGALMLNYQVTR